MVAVGYMDPGNWATDLAGGAQFGYTLLSVILASNLMAILLQGLASKLGIVTGRDLAQACRDHYSKPVGFVLWVAPFLLAFAFMLVAYVSLVLWGGFMGEVETLRRVDVGTTVLGRLRGGTVKKA